MQEYDYLIIGGGIAGTSAAETIRKNDSKGSIAIVSDEPYELYSRIMLSKPPFFLEKIPFDKIFLKNEEWYSENNIDLLKGEKAIKLNADKKTVKLENNNKIQYKKLLLALGAHARPYDIPGSDKKGIFPLRMLDNAKAIMEAKKTAKKAVAIGGGFISFEVSDLLKKSGIDVTLIIREPYFWQKMLDETSGKIVGNAIEKAGVKTLYNSEVQEIIGDEKVEGVILKDGTKIECDMIICGIGVICPNEWLKSSNIELGRGIIANEYLETSLPDVWTAGDAAEYKDVILDEHIIMANWENATEQGRTAGLNMIGKHEIYKHVTFYATHGFGLNIGFIGDARPAKGREIISRGSFESNSYAELIILNDKIIGASLINRQQEINPIKKLIMGKVDISKNTKNLSDPSFDLTIFS
jgi:NAD(P)H-nitrite reductase large subunit